MKVRASELLKILDTIDEIKGFLIATCDFVDDDQKDYVNWLIDSTRGIEDTITRITGK